MEDVYSVKVKTKPDRRNVYPSERRYSASTVSGLAWVHIALAFTSFLLACLALVTPTSEMNLNTDDYERNNSVEKSIVTDIHSNTLTNDSFIESQDNITDSVNHNDVKKDHILVLAPTLLSIFAMAAGVAAILASVRWYVDRNISWLFFMSVLSMVFALTAFIMILTWLVTNNEDLSEFVNDKPPFTEYLVLKHADIVDRNDSHYRFMIKSETVNQEFDENDNSRLFTKKVLSINILIAAFLELLWSVLSIKISYKGMRSNYKEEEAPRGNCVTVITEIKGNNAKNNPRNRKLMPSKTNLMEYPNSKIRRIFFAQNDNEFYMKNQNNKEKQNTETSSEFYKERMLNFLNRCASLEGISNPEAMPGEDMDTSNSTVNLNPIPEITNAEINTQKESPKNKEVPPKLEEPKTPDNTLSRMTPVSWGDTPEHTIYNQNTLNLEKIFDFKHSKKLNKNVAKTNEKTDGSGVTENTRD